MRSSPSSSEGTGPERTSSDRNGGLRAAPMLQSLLIGLLAALLALACWEAWLRVQGAEPHLRVTPERWALARERLEQDASPDAIAILGASRARSGLSHAMLRDELGAAAVHNLAIAGEGPYAAFADIARNSEFRGLVILQLLPPLLAPGFGRYNQQSFVDFYHRDWSPSIRFETLLGNAIQRRFAFTYERYSLQNVAETFLKTGRLFPGRHHVLMGEGRETSLDFSRVPDIGRHRHQRAVFAGNRYLSKPPPDGAAWSALVAEMAADIRAIQARGGRVLVIRLLSAGKVLAIEEQAFPRAAYWDYLAENIPAPSLHFRDDPVLAALPSPDGSHIDMRDKPAQTARIIAKIREEGLMPR